MSYAAQVDIAADRYTPCVRTVVFRGMDLTGVALRMQWRLAGDTPGAPLVDLQNVTNAQAQGLKLVSVEVVDSLPISTVQMRVNETTIESLPYAGELGSATALVYDLQGTLGGDKRVLMAGTVTIGAGVTGADDAPLNRPFGSARSAIGPGGMRNGVTLTFGETIIEVSVDAADLVAPLRADALAARDDAAASKVAAAASLAKAQLAESGAVAAMGTLYPTTAAGLAATAANGFFAVVGDGTSTYAILYQKVSGAAVERARYNSKAAYEGPNGGSLIGYRFAGADSDVGSALSNLPSLLDAFAKTTQAQIRAGTWTSDLSTGIRNAIETGYNFAVPQGVFPFKADMLECRTAGQVIQGAGGILKKMAAFDGKGMLVTAPGVSLQNLILDGSDPNPTQGGNTNDLLHVLLSSQGRVSIQGVQLRGASGNCLTVAQGAVDIDGLSAIGSRDNCMLVVTSGNRGRNIYLANSYAQNLLYITASAGGTDNGKVINDNYFSDLYGENSGDTGAEIGYGADDTTIERFVFRNCHSPGILVRDARRWNVRNGVVYAKTYGDQIAAYDLMAVTPLWKGPAFLTEGEFSGVRLLGRVKRAALSLSQSGVRGTYTSTAFPNAAPAADGSDLSGNGLLIANTATDIHIRGSVDGYAYGQNWNFDGTLQEYQRVDVQLLSTRCNRTMSLFNTRPRRCVCIALPGSGYRQQGAILTSLNATPTIADQTISLRYSDHSLPDISSFPAAVYNPFDDASQVPAFLTDNSKHIALAGPDNSETVISAQAVADGFYSITELGTGLSAQYAVSRMDFANSAAGLTKQLVGNAQFVDTAGTIGLRLTIEGYAFKLQRKGGAGPARMYTITGPGVA